MASARSNRGLKTVLFAGVAALAGGVSTANAQTLLHQDNFEAGWLDWRWTGHSRIQQDANIFTMFNGWHSGHVADVRVVQPILNLLPGEVVRYTVLFDFYAFDSWDGETVPGGGDRFRVSANGATLLNESFSNDPTKGQSFRAPDLVRANYGGRTSALDAIYRNISLTFDAPLDDTKVRIAFSDSGLGGLNDESWGVDNFRLSYTVVPAPGAIGLAMTGGLLMARRRRRA